VAERLMLVHGRADYHGEHEHRQHCGQQPARDPVHGARV
jgi:hypothetical protein